MSTVGSSPNFQDTVKVLARLRGIAKQVYVDDAAAGVTLLTMEWWNELSTFGGSFQCNFNTAMSWLVVKEGLLERAQYLFAGTGIQITTAGHPCLGVAWGPLLSRLPISNGMLVNRLKESHICLYMLRLSPMHPNQLLFMAMCPSGITFAPL